jgi:prepilin-type N-terminal cleavage/methylation domain-containing protein
MWAKQKGFTIVELLIVIVIIAILAAVTVIAFNGVQARARDSQRMSDIKSINKAVKFYIVDNGHAPDFNGNCAVEMGPDNSCYSNDMNGGNSWSALQTALTPYIKTLPVDPCGEPCFDKQQANGSSDGFFTYRYNAPAIFTAGSPTDISYTVFAQNLESKAASFGFGFGSF